MFIKLPSEVPKIIKNIHFCKNGEHLYVTLDFCPKKVILIYFLKMQRWWNALSFLEESAKSNTG